MKVSIVVGEARHEISKPDRFDEDLESLFGRYESEVEEEYEAEPEVEGGRPVVKVRMIDNPESRDEFLVKAVAAWIGGQMDRRISKAVSRRAKESIAEELRGHHG